MARIYRTTKLFCGGSELKVRQVFGNGQPAVPHQVAQALQTARRWLTNVPPFLHVGGDARTASAFRHCFRMDPDPASLNIVRSVLSHITRGLSEREIGIKVLETGGATVGYVSQYFRGRVHTTYNARFYDEDTGWTIARQGEIHLSARALRDPTLAAVTLIHEAGHKFSNLNDHDARGYFDDDYRQYWAPGLTWQEALNNADSHAVFYYYLNRRLERINRRLEAAQDDGGEGLSHLFD